MPSSRSAIALLVAASALGLAAPARALDPTRALTQFARDVWLTKDGLPDGPIHSITQTRDGYLWLGTQTGLARFDGVRFTVFSMRTTPALTASNILALNAAPDGSLWLGVPGAVLHYTDGRFTRFSETEGLSHPYVRSVVPLADGSLWLSTGGSGIWRLRQGRFWQLPDFTAGRWPDVVEALALHPDGTLWAAARGGLLAVSPTHAVRLYTTADGLASNSVNTVYIDRGGRVWAGTVAGLSRLEGQRFRSFTRRDGLPHDDVRALLEDHDGCFWIGTHGGLSRLVDSRFSSLSSGGGLTDNVVLALAEDDHGTLWIGTSAGLNRLHEGAFTPFGQAEGLPTESLAGVAAGPDGVYVADTTGAVRLIRAGRVVTVLPPGTLKGPAPTLARTNDGSVWASGDALFRCRGQRVETYRHLGRELTALAPDGDGLLLAERGATGAFGLYHFAAGRFTRLFPERSLPFVHVHAVARDRRGRVWASTEGGGLHRFGPDGLRVFHLADGLPSETTYSLTLDERDDLWVGTRLGLARVAGERIFAFGAGQGPPRDTLMHAVTDAAGGLWLTWDGGVLRALLGDLQAVADGRRPFAPTSFFRTQDGLRSVELSWRRSAIALGLDGRVHVATSRGVSSVDPRTLDAPTLPPQVIIEELRVDGRPQTLPHGGDASATELQLPPGSDRIDVRYTALGLDHPLALRFRYSLEGYDRGWIENAPEPGDERVAHFTGLTPGHYTFRVSARHGEGRWAEPSATLMFRLAPLWHQQPLFRSLLVLLAGLAALGLHRLRVRRLQAREVILTRRVAERTRALSEEVAERRRAEEDLKLLAEGLEQRVRDRTAQLQATNAALAKDVRQRRRAEQALAAEKERLTVTLRSIADGVIAADTHGCVILMNRVAEILTGHAFDDVRGRPLAEVYRVVDRATRQPRPSPLAAAFDPLAPTASEEDLLLSRDGRELLVAASSAPIHDRRSRVVGAVVVFRDVTEQRRVEEQLQRTEKLEAVGVLAAGIAHDFNNLLTGIFGFIDLARSNASDPQKVERRLGNALEALDRARALARQLLTFSAAGKPVTAPTSVGEILRHSARLILAGSNVEIIWHVPEELWPCQADPHQIGQVLDNLLLNARQAMPAGGRITITAANVSAGEATPANLPSAGCVRIDITDQGGGIPEEIQSRVFDPFFTTKPAGSGLGLATAISIVQQHGGRLDFEVEPGVGTTFHLDLPVAHGAVGAAPRPAEPTLGAQGRILVLDDEEYVRDVAQESLEALGYAVECAATGEAALAAYRQAREEQRPFAVVILDLTVVGGLGGVETLRQLRAFDPDVRAIASSGYSSDAVIAQPEAYGFDATLAKPYTIAELSRVVEGLLRRD